MSNANNLPTANNEIVLATCGDYTYTYPAKKENKILIANITSSPLANKEYMASQNGKFILAFVVSVKRSESSDKKVMYYKKDKSGTGVSSGDQSFNRLFYFADMNDTNAPLGMIIFETSPTEPLELIQSEANLSMIGAPIIIREPTWNGRFGHDNIPILDMDNASQSIVPVDIEYLDIILLPNNVPIKSSTESNQMYFQYNTVYLHLSSVEFFKCCSGVLCDRAHSSPECFCLQKGRSNGVGIKCNIFFSEDPMPVRSIEKWFHTKKYCSYRFSQMFIDPKMKYDVLVDHKNDIVKTMQEKIDAVNETPDKWRICGWYKQGMVTASDPDSTSKQTASNLPENKAKKIPSHEILPHISYLAPRKKTDLDTILTEHLWTCSSERENFHVVGPNAGVPPQSIIQNGPVRTSPVPANNLLDVDNTDGTANNLAPASSTNTTTATRNDPELEANPTHTPPSDVTPDRVPVVPIPPASPDLTSNNPVNLSDGTSQNPAQPVDISNDSIATNTYAGQRVTRQQRKRKDPK